MFSNAVNRIQTERGSRAAYARVERQGGFEHEITEGLAELLSRVDTAFLATASADGQPYVQHRGGPPGFIKPLDDHTLGFVDFKGNRQFVTTGNLSENDRYCLIVIDYSTAERVKFWGRARVVPATPDLVAKLGDPAYRARPEQVILLSVDAWDANCPQHIPRR